jgi:hypothetical protein
MDVNQRVNRLQKEVSQVAGPLYAAITPAERFRLLMESRARGDEAEDRRLMKTCPNKTYTMPDLTLLNQLEAVDTLTLCVCLDLAVPLAKLQMLKAQALLLDYLKNHETDLICAGWYDGYRYGRAEAWRLAGMEGGPPEPGDENGDREELPLPEDEGPAAQWFTGVNSRLIRDLETIALEQWEAFTLFCREDLKLEPETVLEVCMAPALETVQSALAEMQGVEADPARVEERRDLLGCLWRRLAGLESNY